jgi:hypothetical protein
MLLHGYYSFFGAVSYGRWQFIPVRRFVLIRRFGCGQ